jgi:aspartyl-tRNA(Asn)/glutamyl-tRNA(Gln) amidotransferase subunit C
MAGLIFPAVLPIMPSRSMKSGLDIDRVCALAHLQLTEQEKNVLAPQMAKIVEWVGRLEELELPAQPDAPDFHLPFSLSFRPDEVRESQPLEAVLANAPEKDSPFIKVPKVIEEK